MMKKYVFLAVLCMSAVSGHAEEIHKAAPQISVSHVGESDQRMPMLARENNCTACHAIDKKVLGPAWMDVAKKYQGDAGAEARLIVKVSKGGAGNWGTVPMLANDASGKKQDQIRELVRFILALAK